MTTRTTMIRPAPVRPSAGSLLLAAALFAVVLACAGCNSTRSTSNELQSDLVASEQRAREARELFIKADRLRKDGKTTEAVDTYRQSLVLDTSNSAAWHNLGTLLIEQKDYMGAAGALRTAADLAPNDARPLENLGLTYHRAGYDDQALKYYMESLSRDPNWIGSIRGVAMCSYRLNRSTEEILNVLSRGVMLERDDSWSTMLRRERFRVSEQLKAEKDALRREGK
jgi:tetratricopeptide (TPR) repeat protein